ncbi:SMI1/KNR4 family protein [Luedemannella flava]
MNAPRTTGHFEGVDFVGFWDAGSYSLSHYVEPSPTDELIAEVEADLGYRLPDSYVELARMHNGGIVHRPCYPMDEPTCWARRSHPDHRHLLDRTDRALLDVR